MTTKKQDQFTELKFKFIQNRWFVFPLLFGLFYLFICFNFINIVLYSNINFNQYLKPLAQLMPYHIALVSFALAVYGIGWFKRSRKICSLYFVIMIFAFYVGPLLFVYQIVMAVLITLGMIKITKVSGLVYR